jgi:hypothetical protein
MTVHDCVDDCAADSLLSTVRSFRRQPVSDGGDT